MKRISALLMSFLVLLFSGRSYSQQKQGDKDKSLLWKISGKGLSKPSWLFGTVHLICTDDYVWTAKMKTSLEGSDKVCFEMDLDDPNVMIQVAAGLKDNSGKNLKDYFTPAQYKLVQRYMRDSVGIDIALLSGMKPVVLQTMMIKKDAGCANPVSYEETIMKTATAEHKEILGLETPAEQVAVLETMPTDSVIKEVMDAVLGKDNNDGDKEYRELIAAYKMQDLPALYALITAAKDAGTNLGTFLDERNKKWISRIAGKMNDTSVFFAVGAGHLWGANGLIYLLRNYGYTVEPVN